MNQPTLQVIGCGDAFASGGRFQTCFYVQTKSLKFLIDCGATSLVALKKNNIFTDDIDLVVITHFHGDHFGGLPFFILDAAIASKRTKPLTIISPPGCMLKLQEALQLFYPGMSAISEKLKLELIAYHSYQTIELNSFSVKAFPVIHTEETFPHAIRISVDDKIISFSGDTEWTEELIAVAKNADLFMCECNSFDSEIKGHLNYKTLMQNKHRLHYKKILLTHFGNEMFENLHNVELDCAEDGKIVVF